MRITNKSILIPYQRNLEEIQNRRFEEQMRISSGKNILNLSDAPDKVARVKQLTALIENNMQYLNNFNDAIKELNVVDEQLSSIAEGFQDIRLLALDASKTSNASTLDAIAEYIKGILSDLVSKANVDFRGQFLFSGTLTRPESIIKTDPQQNDLPFELLKGTPDLTNPSGLSVIFKGNTKDRILSKDSQSTEVINVKSDELFGTGGTEYFDTVINLYNLLAYKSDGTKRGKSDFMTAEEYELLEKYQKEIAEIYDSITNLAGKNGASINRFQALSDQTQNEISLLKEIRSNDEDTDIAAATLKLMQNETALQYSLQIGAKILPQTLFDFLT
jgi:flagellin-like hook-associated protein FlgL